jgi:ubiquinone/menaquinone biosynthesis C-methylase UbiE
VALSVGHYHFSAAEVSEAIEGLHAMALHSHIRRWVWLCPFVMLGAAAGIFMLLGLSAWTALLATCLLVCPALLVWGALQVKRRQRPLLLDPIPGTRGVPLNWMAPFYDRLCKVVGLGESFRQETLRYAAMQPGEGVLDVGCGTGVLTRLAAEVVGPAGWVVGIDPAPMMIALAWENAALAGKRAEFRLAAVEHLPFADQTFDAVLASFVMHHLPPEVKRAELQEVYRVLKPGGRLVVVDIDWSQARPVWRLLGWPLGLIPLFRDHWAGRLSSYFIQTGFRPVEAVGRWRWCWGFWVAYKPAAS